MLVNIQNWFMQAWQTFLDSLSLQNLWQLLQNTFGNDGEAYLQAIVKILVGLLLARIARAFVVRGFKKRSSRQHLMLIRRAVSYGIFFIFFISALQGINFPTEWFLGAAGVLTIALGFASQTSVSNLISGLFLLGEGTMEVGDIVEISGTTGEVLSVDLLSTKLRTFDNMFIRIPNETIIKSKVTNISRMPIRRIDIPIQIAYSENLSKVRELLEDLAYNHPLALEEPSAMLFTQGFGDSGVNLQFSVWAIKENFLELKSDMYEGIKQCFEEHNIEIPFPHIKILRDEKSQPLAKD